MTGEGVKIRTSRKTVSGCWQLEIWGVAADSLWQDTEVKSCWEVGFGGGLGESNPRPHAPEARIIPLDQIPTIDKLVGSEQMFMEHGHPIHRHSELRQVHQLLIGRYKYNCSNRQARRRLVRVHGAASGTRYSVCIAAMYC